MLRKIIFTLLVVLVIIGLTAGTILTYYIQADVRFIMPVKNASRNDYSQKSMGSPRVGHKHKGADIFQKKVHQFCHRLAGLLSTKEC